VPEDLQAALIRPFLTDRSKTLIAKLDPAKSRVYKEIKTAILRDYKVSSPMYRDKFNDLVKPDDHTYVMYTSTLFSLITGYLESRKVTDFDNLKNLLVSDRIKATLKLHILKYVLSVEAKSTNGWLLPYEMAEVIDYYLANYHETGGTKQVTPNPKPKPNTSRPSTSNFRRDTNTAYNGIKDITCWQCGGPHLKKNCPQVRQADVGSAGVQPLRRVNKVSTRSSDNAVIESQVMSAVNADESQTQTVNLVRHAAVDNDSDAVMHDFTSSLIVNSYRQPVVRRHRLLFGRCVNLLHSRWI